MPRKKPQPTPEQLLLQEMSDAACRAIKARGWRCYIQSQDTKSWRYVEFFVEKDFNFSHHVEGALSIELTDDQVSCRVRKTSFYGTGLNDLPAAVMDEVKRVPWIKSAIDESKKDKISPSGIAKELEQIFRRFDRFSRQLCRRHAGRDTIKITDEYDVQDLVHSILRMLVEDVRAEEFVPSYGGSSSRIDFFLKDEKIAIEIKFASVKLRDKQIGEQLIVDIERYKVYPECERLICLVYDPNGSIHNPTGLENDLSGRRNNLDVRVIVTPK